MAATPVRIYSEDDVRLPARLNRILQDRIDAISQYILTGQLSERDYRFCAGKLEGLREALSDSSQIGKELSGS